MGNIVMLDIIKGLSQGEVLDLVQSGPVKRQEKAKSLIKNELAFFISFIPPFFL